MRGEGQFGGRSLDINGIRGFVFVKNALSMSLDWGIIVWNYRHHGNPFYVLESSLFPNATEAIIHRSIGERENASVHPSMSPLVLPASKLCRNK